MSRVIKPKPKKKRSMISKKIQSREGLEPVQRLLLKEHEIPREAETQTIIATPVLLRMPMDVKVEELDKKMDFTRFKKRKRRF
jgi:hypothetical protein